MMQSVQLTFLFVGYLFINQYTKVKGQQSCADAEISMCFCEFNRFTCNSKNLGTIPASIPSNMDQLLLRSNNITEITDTSFQGLPDLFEIDLDRNQIETISENAFRNNPKLRSLYLRDNSLVSLPTLVFLNQPSLVRLHLENNKIEILAVTMLNHTTIQILNLAGNPTKCCLMVDFVTWLQDTALQVKALDCTDFSSTISYDVFDAANCSASAVEGQWSDWNISNCSSSCGVGSITKTRSCDNPPPSGGGNHCVGISYDTESCNLAPCQSDSDGSSSNEMMPLIAGVVVGVSVAAGVIALATIVLIKKASKEVSPSKTTNIAKEENGNIWS